MAKDKYGLYIGKSGNVYSVFVSNVFYREYGPDAGKFEWMSGWSLGFNFNKKKHALGLMKVVGKYLMKEGFPVITRQQKPKK